MTKTCEMLAMTEEGQHVVAKILLTDGKISGVPVDPNWHGLNSVLTNEHYVGRQKLTSENDPEKWFATLPETYSGSYLRARIVTAGDYDMGTRPKKRKK